LKTNQLVHADQVLAKKRKLIGEDGSARVPGQTDQDLSHTPIMQFDVDNMWSYWATCRDVGRRASPQHLAIGQDALDVGNMKVEISVIYFIAQKLAFWGPPQVIRDSLTSCCRRCSEKTMVQL
jgi:hypothetical protein